MKVALLSPIGWRTPPRKYGRRELVVSNLAEGLVKINVDVTLFATGDSVTSGKLAWVFPRPLREDSSLEHRVYEYLHTAYIFERASEFDLIHNNFDCYPLTFSKFVKTPILTTIRGLCSFPAAVTIYRRYNDTYYVSISNADRRAVPDLNYVATVYHGVKLEDFDFSKSVATTFSILGGSRLRRGSILL